MFLYRAFHETYSSGVNSSNGFESGLLKSEYTCSDRTTLLEHFDLANRNRTPWISTTDDLLCAIKRAIQLAEEHGIAGVRIAVIDLNACRYCEYYLAKDLAADLNLGYAQWQESEFLFRWQIPDTGVAACLTLETLQRRGLYAIIPQVLQQGSVGQWRDLMREEWWNIRPQLHLQEVAQKAVEVAFLFGHGGHTEHIGLEAAWWWEQRVGRIVKEYYYELLALGTDHPEYFD